MTTDANGNLASDGGAAWAAINTNIADIAALKAGIGSGVDLSDLRDDVDTNTTDIGTNSDRIDKNEADIRTNTTNIATNRTNISRNTTNIANNSANIATLQNDVSSLQIDFDALAVQADRNSRAIRENTDGIAIANALAGSTWLQSNEQYALSANWGYYGGSNGLAISGAARIDGRLSANFGVGVGSDTGHVGARAGVRWGW